MLVKLPGVAIAALLVCFSAVAAVVAQEPSQTAESMSLKGQLVALLKAGKFADAVPLAEALLRQIEKDKGQSSVESGTIAYTLAWLYQLTGRLAKAESLYVRAKEIFEKAYGTESRDTAEVTYRLGTLYLEMEDYSKAEPLLRLAFETRRRLIGMEHLDTVESEEALARAYLKLQLTSKAEPLFLKALEVRKKLGWTEDSDFIATLNDLAILYVWTGVYTKAASLFDAILESATKLNGLDSLDAATIQTNIGSLYAITGDFEQAKARFESALNIIKRRGETNAPIAAEASKGLGKVLLDVGRFAEAEEMLKAALRISQECYGAEGLGTATFLHLLGHFYQDTGNYSEAEHLYKHALTIDQSHLPADHPSIIRELNDLGLLYEKTGNLQAAESVLGEAVQAERTSSRGNDELAGYTFTNAELLMGGLGKNDEAEALAYRALEIFERVFGSQHPTTARAAENLAVAYQRLAKYTEAEPLIEQALAVFRERYGDSHPTTLHAMQSLAWLEIDAKHSERAEPLVGPSAKAEDEVFGRMLAFMSEQQRLAYQDTINPYSLPAALPGAVDRLGAAILRYKGIVLDSIIDDRATAEALPGEAGRDLLAGLAVAKRQYGQLLLATTAKAADLNHEGVALEQRIEETENKIAALANRTGSVRRGFACSVKEVANCLPKDAVLVEYIMYVHYIGQTQFDRWYGAAVVTSSGELRWVPLGDAGEIDRLIDGSKGQDGYKQLVRASDKADEAGLTSCLTRLYQLIWEPIANVISPDVHRVICSPDSELNFVSFATLLTPQSHFLAEDDDIQYVASGRDLLRETAAATNADVVILANPSFDCSLAKEPSNARQGSGISETRGGFRGQEMEEVSELDFDPIEGTGMEAKELESEFRKLGWNVQKPLLGQEATKQALFKVRSPYILHLATHGFFVKEDKPREPAQELQSVSLGRPDVTASKFFSNPLHRSGLALAGAETTVNDWRQGRVIDHDEDGILTAEDVSTLDLRSTWLVTLSACDTGSGEAKAGEGVLGLRRGFIEAGAQNLLMSLWPIDDRATVPIMTEFYQAANAIGKAPQALAHTQRDWLVSIRDGKGPQFERVKNLIQGSRLRAAVQIAGPFIMTSQGKP